MKRFLKPFLLALTSITLLTACSKEELLEDYTVIGYTYQENDKEYLVNFAGIEDLNQVGVSYYELEDSDLPIDKYLPIKVSGTLNLDTGELINPEQIGIAPEDFETNQYLLAYYNLSTTGGLSKIQKYTNLAIALILSPDDEAIKEEFNTISQDETDWFSLTGEINPKDELLLSLGINLEQLFESKNIHVAESVVNQLNELISKASMF